MRSVSRDGDVDQMDAALKYLDCGLSVIPLRARGKKPPPGFRWKPYQHERPTKADIRDWFDADAPRNLAIMCGGVSENLAVADFDNQASYKQWAADFPELAKTSPTVRTGRNLELGTHVYFRTRKTISSTTQVRFDSLRAEGSYVVAPQSIHSSGRPYRLLGGDFSKIPVIDDSVLERLLTQADSPHTSRHIACVRSSVEEAILATLPTGPGQRNHAVFRLARALKSISGLDDSPTNLRQIVSQWHRQCLHVITTKDFTETWKDFVISWGRIKHTAAGRWAEISKAARNEQDPPESLIYDSVPIRRLAALCSVLQRHHRDEAFFLSSRLAGDVIGLAKTQAAELIKVLAFDGLIELVTPANRIAHRAAEYRWCGEVQS